MRVKHRIVKRGILKVLSRDWQTSAEISYKSGRPSTQVAPFVNWLTTLGYVEKMDCGKRCAWRLKEGLTADLVMELLEGR